MTAVLERLFLKIASAAWHKQGTVFTLSAWSNPTACLRSLLPIHLLCWHWEMGQTRWRLGNMDPRDVSPCSVSKPQDQPGMRQRTPCSERYTKTSLRFSMLSLIFLATQLRLAALGTYVNDVCTIRTRVVCGKQFQHANRHVAYRSSINDPRPTFSGVFCALQLAFVYF
jgi:hypothetical protein